MSIFSKVSLRAPKRNKFNLSHDRKFSMAMGNATPIMCLDVVPGDKVRLTTELMMRWAPMLAPMMHMVNVYTYYFFVPDRLVWNESKEFYTGGEDGTSAPVRPFITMNEANKAYFGEGSLADYLGLPPIDPAVTVTQAVQVNANPFRAYQMVYNEYIRDQNVTDPVSFGIDSGSADADIAVLTAMRKRAWEKDYFTSALPWAQRGGDVNIPATGEFSPQYSTFATFPDGGTGPMSVLANARLSSGAAEGRLLNLDDPQILNDVNINVNDLRTSVRLQEWLERNARGGSRYIEQILAHFGVRSSDARLQRPEYLGGGKTPVSVSEVLSTFQQSAEGIPQGNMAGHGIAVGSSKEFTRQFEEHGYVIGLMTVVPKTAYQQGIAKHWTRTSNLDYLWPTFANLGEQEVKVGELWYDPTAAVGEISETFGYQSRYAEYKYMPSSVHGAFRSSLAYWQMGRIFDNKPTLSTQFIEADPTTRVFAVEAQDEHLYCHVYNNLQMLRPLPYFGTPRL